MSCPGSARAPPGRETDDILWRIADDAELRARARRLLAQRDATGLSAPLV
jgi:hypothetical protein